MITHLPPEDFGKEEQWTRPCSHCGKTLLTPLRGRFAQEDLQKLGDHRLDGLSVECDCPGAVAERKAHKEKFEQEEEKKKEKQDKELFEESGMPEPWRSRRLADWKGETEQRRYAFRKVSKYGNKIVERVYPGVLYISGDIGTGKTFLASCLARELHREGVHALWTKVGDIIRELNDAHKSYKKSEQDVIDKYGKARVLILDDLGKERPTEWMIQQLYAIIDGRCENERATVITSNYCGSSDLLERLTPTAPPNEYADDTTGRAIIDRIKEGVQITLTGESWRGEAGRY